MPYGNSTLKIAAMVLVTVWALFGCQESNHVNRKSKELRFQNVDGSLLRSVSTSEDDKLMIFDSPAVKDADLIFLRNCTSVKELYIVRVGITGEGLKYVGDMRQLEHITVKACAIQSNCLRHLHKLKNLKQIHLNQCGFLEDRDVKQLLDKLVNVEIVNLDDIPNLTDQGVGPLLAIPHLRYVRLSNTGVSPEFVNSLRSRGVGVDR